MLPGKKQLGAMPDTTGREESNGKRKGDPEKV